MGRKGRFCAKAGVPGFGGGWRPRVVVPGLGAGRCKNLHPFGGSGWKVGGDLLFNGSFLGGSEARGFRGSRVPGLEGSGARGSERHPDKENPRHGEGAGGLGVSGVSATSFVPVPGPEDGQFLPKRAALLHGVGAAGEDVLGVQESAGGIVPS